MTYLTWTHPDAKIVIDYNRYKGIGRPRSNDYTTTVRHLFEESTTRSTNVRIKKSQPVNKVVIEKSGISSEDLTALILFGLLIGLPILGMILNNLGIL